MGIRPVALQVTMNKVLQMPLFMETVPPLERSRPTKRHEDQGPPDAAQRSKALDIGRSWVVEAPAGSGKTGLLVQRYLKLLAFGEVGRPDEVLAITFTRKASAEMRQRIVAELTQAASDQELPADAPAFLQTSRKVALEVLARDKQLGWELLADPHQLNIRTIDSLCSSIAASRPLMSGAGARYTPTEDAAPLYALAAERTLLLMGHAAPDFTRDLERLLLLRDASAVDFGRLLAGMLQHREQWGALLPLDANTLTDQALDTEIRPRLERTLRQVVGEQIAAITSKVPDALWSDLAAFAHACSRIAPYKSTASPLLEFLSSPERPATTSEDLGRWKALLHLLCMKDGWRKRVQRGDVCFEISKEGQQHLQDLVRSFQESTSDPDQLVCDLLHLRSLPQGGYPEEQWELVKPLCRVLQRALVELQILFAERRTCDFTEVSLNARSLLQHPEEALELPALSFGRLRHLLVDEMQDTSAGQYDLLERLTDGWDGSTQTVFLVGDPKQSIYEFRLARVERFRRMMREARFGQLSVMPLVLTANFRSQAGLVHAFNQTFQTVFPSETDLEQESKALDVPFVAAAAVRQPKSFSAMTWHSVTEAHSGGNDQEEFPERAAELQAEQMFSVIQEYLEGQQPPERKGRPRIAVLARARAHLAPILRLLRGDERHPAIPFRAVDVEPLTDRAEVTDLLSLTRALLDPSDRIAWLAVLRSPLCGLSLYDLLQLTGEGPSAAPEATIRHLIATREPLLSADGRAALGRVWPLLAQAIQDGGRQPLAVQVERLWRTMGGDAALSLDASLNAERYLHLLRQMENAGDEITLLTVQRRMERLYAAPHTGPADIELMTIHKAKGLEWDLVLIPRLEAPTAIRESEFLRWLEFDRDGLNDGENGFLLAPIAPKGEDPSDLFRWMGAQQTEREAAEAKRVFYVAATRAREALHLFATVNISAAGEPRQPRASSLLRACWPAAKAALDIALSEQIPVNAPVLSFPQTPQKSGLHLAAAAEESFETVQAAQLPLIHRIPVTYLSRARFERKQGAMLPYEPANSLKTQALFDRPEGSFEARAFGNTVHRVLPWLANRLASGLSPENLFEEASSWLPRLQALLRSEGLSARQAFAAAPRVQDALRATLADPDGIWLLMPHALATNETSLSGAGRRELPGLRADRTFRAGASREEGGTEYLWIVDYKTGEPGGRDREPFLADQHRKYESTLR